MQPKTGVRILGYSSVRSFCLCWHSRFASRTQVAQPTQAAMAAVSSSTKPEKKIRLI